jgi:hypothetical protein
VRYEASVLEVVTATWLYAVPAKTWLAGIEILHALVVCTPFGTMLNGMPRLLDFVLIVGNTSVEPVVNPELRHEIP